MIDQVRISVRAGKYRLSARCHISHFQTGEFIISHHLKAISDIAFLILHQLSGRIQIWSGDLFTAKLADLVAFLTIESAKRYKQIIVSGLRRIGQIRPFTRMMPATDQMIAKIGIHTGRLILLRMDRQPGLRIDLQQEYAPGPGTIYHPQLSVLVLHDGRIDTIRPFFIIVSPVLEIPTQIRIFTKHLFQIRLIHRRCLKTRIQYRIGVSIRSTRCIRDGKRQC